jgi:hypothetical protein
VLEAVEVEEHEHERLGEGRPRELALEPAGQGAPVAEACQRVRLRLLARGAQHRDVVAEREHRAHHHGDQRGGGERDRDGVEMGETAVDQQAETGGAEGEREHDPAQALVRTRGERRARGLPGGGADQHQPEPPADVEPRARRVRAVRVADEVERVGEPERGDAAEQQHPRSVQLPAGAGQRAYDEADQDQVGEGVGEPHGNLQRLPGGAVEHGLEDDRGARGRDGEGGRDPVGPERAGNVARAAAQERQDPDQHERREQQIADVGRRGDRDLLRRPQDRGVVDLAERPSRDADADQQPGAALRAALRRDPGPEAERGRDDQGHVVSETCEQRPDLEVGREQDTRLPERQPDGDTEPDSAPHGARTPARFHNGVIDPSSAGL